jgi:hypothetical protein
MQQIHDNSKIQTVSGIYTVQVVYLLHTAEHCLLTIRKCVPPLFIGLSEILISLSSITGSPISFPKNKGYLRNEKKTSHINQYKTTYVFRKSTNTELFLGFISWKI